MLMAAFPVAAATPSHGPAALRNLAVGPNVKITFGYKFAERDCLEVLIEDKDLSGDIRRLQSGLKEHPGDVRQMNELADMLDQTGATNAARQAWEAVEKLCRKHLETTPEDGMFLMRLGEALDGLGQKAEAESDFRRAALVCSNEWRCWAGLGDYLEAGATTALFAPLGRFQPGPVAAPHELLDYHPSPDALQQYEVMNGEAARCLDRSAKLGSKDPEMWVNLARYASCSNWEARVIAHYKGEDHPPLDSAGWTAAFLCPACLADFKQAEELGRTNYNLIAGACFFNVMAEHIREPDATPESLQQTAREEIRLLENLGSQPDKKAAAGALVGLGFVKTTLGDASGARACAREAAAADPTLNSAWELQIALAAASGTPEELVGLCESRLKQEDTPRNRLFLAKAFLRQERPEKAAEQAQAILKMEETNVAAYIVLAAADLKRSDNPQFLDAAGRDLNAAMILAGTMPTSDESLDRRREVSLDLAIWCGLQDDPEERKKAKDVLQAVLAVYPDDQTAKDILQALE